MKNLILALTLFATTAHAADIEFVNPYATGNVVQIVPLTRVTDLYNDRFSAGTGTNFVSYNQRILVDANSRQLYYYNSKGDFKFTQNMDAREVEERRASLRHASSRCPTEITVDYRRLKVIEVKPKCFDLAVDNQEPSEG